MTVLDELGLRIAAEASASLSNEEDGIFNSRWSVFFMSVNRCCKTLIVCEKERKKLRIKSHYLDTLRENAIVLLYIGNYNLALKFK